MQKMKLLKNLIGSLDTVYIDSTFFSSMYENFPEQIRSAKTICGIIKEWLNNNPRHIISLKMPARYGYEILFIEIAALMKTKIHILDDEMKNYKYIPELDNIFTTISQKSRIHACFDYFNKNGKHLTCDPTFDPALIRVIKPTAMIWREWQESMEIVKKEPNEYVRVCYSNHSSCSEIRDFLMFLKPKNVELNVIPTEPNKRKDMLEALSEVMANCQSNNCGSVKLSTNVHVETIHLSKWDNLSKVSKLHLNVSTKTKETEEQLLLMCPPKRKKQF